MSAAAEFVTQEQHQALSSEVRTTSAAGERLAVRVEVISHDTTRLLREVADLREDIGGLRDELHQHFEAMEARFDEKLAAMREALLKEVRDGHATLLSAILQLGTRQ
ncbi:MAG: hypothetical protein MUC96_34595 [Myxococcaceae bacterium]|nr:hypothetical protein [Myxococcaceae bacterium]